MAASQKGTILLIEDDRETRSLVQTVLEGAGFEVQVADTVFIGRNMIKNSPPSLVIMDRKLPDADSLELCAELRHTQELVSIPILFLSALRSPAEKIAGLRTGGDDYLTKPFSNGELLARVDALLRRAGILEHGNLLEFGGLKIDLAARRVLLDDKEVELWQKEYDLLLCLVKNKGRVLDRPFLLQQVWDYDPNAQPSAKIVDVLISHLRAKLGDFGGKIVAVRGVGYRMDLVPPAPPRTDLPASA